MTIISMMMTMAMMIIMIMLIIINMLSKKYIFEKEKNSPFECGFDPKNNSRMPFSLQFFLIGIIFLIFDVELSLLLPMIKLTKMINIYSPILTTNLFITILMLGLFHEWNQGALKWLK
uniref:NADH-ubiquinone oxidoreductase chain 3 n=1 Tax=Arescus labiatus TaxID=294769 RepID=U3KZR5_9CUCU|nr:NADH dehydrogenase subunit 3 [Arescus labiatus]